MQSETQCTTRAHGSGAKMNDDIICGLEVRTVPLSPEDVMQHWSSHIRELTQDVVFTVIFFSFRHDRVASNPAARFRSRRLRLLGSVTIGFYLGALITLCILAKSEYRYFCFLRADLKSMRCEHLTITSSRAIAVNVSNNSPSLAA